MKSLFFFLLLYINISCAATNPIPKICFPTLQNNFLLQNTSNTIKNINKPPAAQKTNSFECETMCCRLFQNAIKQNNAVLGFQMDNCQHNATSESNYNSCIDAVLYAYQSTATTIFLGYTICLSIW